MATQSEEQEESARRAAHLESSFCTLVLQALLGIMCSPDLQLLLQGPQAVLMAAAQSGPQICWAAQNTQNALLGGPEHTKC